MFFSSIRFKLTLWFASILALALLFSALVWHSYLSQVMLRNVDDHLLLIAGEITAFHQQHHLMTEDDKELCTRTDNFTHNFNWAGWFQLSSPQGELSCSTQDPAEWRFPLPEGVQRAALSGNKSFSTLTLQREPLTTIRVLTTAIQVEGRTTDILQVGSDLQANEATLARLRNTLIFFSPLMVFCVAISAWFVAGRALAPVTRITEEIRNVTAERLSARLSLNEHPNELTLLTQTFNEMLERLQDSFTRIRQFTGDASHELRTPLAILRGETEVALRWAKGEEELRAALVSNLEEINRMERITEGLLYLAKEDAGELRLSLVSFSLTDLLQDVYLIGSSLGEAKDLSVSLHLNTNEEIFISADQMHLHRALLNLVTNAVKYTPTHGAIAITLSLEAADRFAVITVADNGIGIAPEHLPYIFERFYRTDDARNRDIGGSGLGLSIVRSIVSAHGGSISVTSEPERGSSFIVKLPLSSPKENSSTNRLSGN